MKDRNGKLHKPIKRTGIFAKPKALEEGEKANGHIVFELPPRSIYFKLVTKWDHKWGRYQKLIEFTSPQFAIEVNKLHIGGSPESNAGSDQSIKDRNNDGMEGVTLDGSNSRDPDGNIASYVWTKDGEQIATEEKPTVELGVGKHVIILTVTDNDGATDKDKVIITVIPGDVIPPTCSIHLRKQGRTSPIDEIEVGKFIDISVEDSTDDSDIGKVRFSSDDSQDGNPTGKWTKWYNWDTSFEDWNAETKIKKWSFATGGAKEVWAEVKDSASQTSKCYADIYANIPLAQIIQQQVVSKTSVSVNKQKYHIVSMNCRIDPLTLRCQDDPGTTKVYVDKQWNPVSDPETLRKINLIDYALQESNRVNLSVRLETLKELKSEYRDFHRKDMVLSAENAITSSTIDVLKLKEELRVVNSSQKALTNLQKMKDLATESGGIITSLVTFLMKELIWNPMEDMKGDLEDKISLAIEKYESAQNTLKDNIVSYEDANSFVSSYQFGKAYEEESRFLFEKIFKNYGRVLLKIEPLSKVPQWGSLFEFVKVALEAKDAVDWSYEVNTKWIAEIGEDFCAQCYWFAIPKVADYTLKLTGSSLADFPEFRKRYTSCKENFNKPLEDLIDYLDNPVKLTLSELGNQLSSWKNKLASWSSKWEKRLSSFIDKISDFIIGVIHSPGELRVYDSQGRVTGVVNGVVKEGIPHSISLQDVIIIFHPLDSYNYEVAGTDKGTYGLSITSVIDGESTTFTSKTIPTSAATIHQYTVDWDALAQGEKGVTLQIDSNNDGVFEQTMKVGSSLEGTASGSQVKKEFADQDATLIFDKVTTPGITNLMSMSKLPFDFSSEVKFQNKFYKFETTASFSGDVTIKIQYDDSDLKEEEALKLFKIRKNQKVHVSDITTNLDTENNVIIAKTDSDGFFGLGLEAEKSSLLLFVITPVSVTLLLLAIIYYIWKLRKIKE